MSSAHPATQRQFFALWPDAPLRERLSTVQRQIALPPAARLTAPANLHLTLAFLGAVSPAQGLRLHQTVAQLRAPRFTLTLDHLGHWPAARVLWLGPTRAPPPLLALARALEEVALACGVTLEARPYRAHVTLARNVRTYTDALGVAPLPWRAREFSLVESLSTGQGVQYRPLASWPLIDGGEVPAAAGDEPA